MSKQLASSNPPTNFSSQAAFNYSQAAAYAGVKFSAIETVVREGRLAARKVGRNVIVLKRDLDNFLASLDVVFAPTAVPPRDRIAFTLRQAAEVSGTSIWFLRQNIKSGGLRARLADKKFLIVADDLADFVKHLPRRRAA